MYALTARSRSISVPCTRHLASTTSKPPTFASPKHKPAQAPAAARRPRRHSPPIWTPPLTPGKLKAYDEALNYIRADSHALKREIAQLKAEHLASAAAAAKAGHSHDPEALERYRAKLHVLEVQSEINLPEVRWTFKTGRFPYTKPVYRHLTEQKWRSEGTLDLLMERLYQMSVIPDLLPTLRPTVDLRIQFEEPTPRTVLQRARQNRGFQSVEPGSFLLPEQTRRPPRVSATAFHTDTRLYTMIMLDPDVPDEETSSFQTYLHWMQPNISLSGTRRISIIEPVVHLPYIPPHPQRGTPYHRYVLLLLPHPSPSEPLAIPVPSDTERLGFDLRAFVSRWGLDQAQGGGAHMWREVWDDNVTDLYRDVLKVPEPRYGRLPKYDPYVELKERKRYVM